MNSLNNTSGFEDDCLWVIAAGWMTSVVCPFVLFAGLFGNGICLGALWNSSTAQDLSSKLFLRGMLITHTLYIILACSAESFYANSLQKYNVRFLINCNTYELLRGALMLLSSWLLVLLLIKRWSIQKGKGGNYLHLGKCAAAATCIALLLNWHCFGGLVVTDTDSSTLTCTGRVTEITTYYRDIYPWVEVVSYYYLPLLCGLVLSVALIKKIPTLDKSPEEPVVADDNQLEKQGSLGTGLVEETPMKRPLNQFPPQSESANYSPKKQALNQIEEGSEQGVLNREVESVNTSRDIRETQFVDAVEIAAEMGCIVRKDCPVDERIKDTLTVSLETDSLAAQCGSMTNLAVADDRNDDTVPCPDKDKVETATEQEDPSLATGVNDEDENDRHEEHRREDNNGNGEIPSGCIER